MGTDRDCVSFCALPEGADGCHLEARTAAGTAVWHAVCANAGQTERLAAWLNTQSVSVHHVRDVLEDAAVTG